MYQIYLTTKTENWNFEKVENYYLFSYIFRFLNAEKITDDKIFLSRDYNKMFTDVLELALSDLLEENYIKPEQKKIQKHSTRYERFVFKETKYVVNYTTSVLGRLIYTLYLRIKFVKDNPDVDITIEAIN
ncbi:hypothetical protein [Tenacibaculum maritimum]|uniref:hypothetical protein n=1 Tax=Tenacibaculum maritimum TaxID=107401 RepID=UPI00388FAAB0